MQTSTDYTHGGLEVHCEDATIGHLSSLAAQGLPCPARPLGRGSTSSSLTASLMHLTCWNMGYIGHKLNTGDLLDHQLIIPTRNRKNKKK